MQLNVRHLFPHSNQWSYLNVQKCCLGKRWWELTNSRTNRTRTILWRETLLLSKLSLRFNKIQSKPLLKKNTLRGKKNQRKSVIGENDQRVGAPGKVSRAGQPRAVGHAARQNPGGACWHAFLVALTRPSQTGPHSREAVSSLGPMEEVFPETIWESKVLDTAQTWTLSDDSVIEN